MAFDPSAFLSFPEGLPGEPDDLAWLAGLLREMMAAVAAEEGDTFRKAGMIARLSALFLRASRAADLKRAYQELARRHAETEERLAALEACLEEPKMTPARPPSGRGKSGASSRRTPAAVLAATTTPRSAGPSRLAPKAGRPVPLVTAPPARAAAPT